MTRCIDCGGEIVEGEDHRCHTGGRVSKPFCQESPREFAGGFSEESGEHPLPESALKAWQVAKPAVDAYQEAHPQQSAAIRIERVSRGLWRVYSEFDGGEFVDITTQGMKALLDELLKLARQFGDQEASEEEDEDEDETPEKWQIREPKSLINRVPKPNEVI